MADKYANFDALSRSETSGIDSSITVRRGCFRHQLLLCRQRHPRLIDNGQGG
jgi:hypothetical protein